MSYKAVTTFTDLQDNSYKYQAGDTFPREGLKVSKKRLEELLTDKNRRHKPVIEEIEDEETQPEKVDEPKPAPKKGGRKKADAK